MRNRTPTDQILRELILKLPNNALQLTFDPASRLAAAKQLSAPNAAELGR